MTFFNYDQNNSGGSFVVDKHSGVSHRVIIEADTPDGANSRAEEIGLYFDGDGDCSCCGDRWYPVDGYDKEDEPNIYGTTFTRHGDVYYYVVKDDHLAWTDPEGYLHLKDGAFYPIIAVSEEALEVVLANPASTRGSGPDEVEKLEAELREIERSIKELRG